MYTGLRVALLALVWLLIQVVTPMRGLLAIAVALIISGIISFILLDRTRDRASAGLAGVFRRIDDRIERSKAAEDIDDETVPSGQSQAQAEQQPVGEHEQPGGLEHGHEGTASGAAHDSGDGPDGQRRGEQSQPREGESESSR